MPWPLTQCSARFNGSGIGLVNHLLLTLTRCTRHTPACLPLCRETRLRRACLRRSKLMVAIKLKLVIRSTLTVHTFDFPTHGSDMHHSVHQSMTTFPTCQPYYDVRSRCYYTQSALLHNGIRMIVSKHWTSPLARHSQSEQLQRQNFDVQVWYPDFL